MSKQVSGGRQGASPTGVWEESASGRGSSRCKGPGLGVGLASSGTREASVAGQLGEGASGQAAWPVGGCCIHTLVREVSVGVESRLKRISLLLLGVQGGWEAEERSREI